MFFDRQLCARVVKHGGVMYRWIVLDGLKRLDGLSLCIVERGRRIHIGEGTPLATVNVLSKKAWRRLFYEGDIGFAKAYMNQELTVDHPLPLVEFFAKLSTDYAVRHVMDWWVKKLLAVRQLFLRNTKEQAKKNISAHYDVGNDYYEHLLGAKKLYSCHYFHDETHSLDQAEEQTIKRSIQKLEIEPGMSILEIGCGWGGITLALTEQPDCYITAVTLSKQQYDYVKQKIKENNLQNRVYLKRQDYRDIEGQFDRIISIEMMEAVGYDYIPDFCQQLETLLKPGGLIFLQYISFVDNDLYFLYTKGGSFIKTEVFPGGDLINDDHFDQVLGQCTRLTVTDRSFYGGHYVRTLTKWLDNLYNKKEAILSLGYSEQFFLFQEMYLIFCIAAFKTSVAESVQVTLKRSQSDILIDAE